MAEQLLQNRIQELEQALLLAQKELLDCQGKLVQAEQRINCLLEEKRISLNSNNITTQETVENQLVIERRGLNNISEDTNVGTWEWNIQTGEIIFNERWANIIGYTLSELQPINIDTWTKFAHPEDLQVSSELLNQYFAGEREDYMCEVRMRHKDGHWVWVLDRGKVYTWTDNGKPLWMSGTHQDITERKLLEEQRVFEHINQEALINSTKDLIWSINKDYQLITANQAFIESVKDFSGVTIKPGNFILSTEFFSDELINFWKNIYDSALAGKTFNQEYSRLTKANQGAWLDLTINPIWNGQEITGLACFGRDITQRKLAENALRLSEQQLKTIIETEPECVKVVNAKGDLLEMNKAGLAMLEVNSLEEAKSHSLFEFILPPYRLAFKALHQQVMQGENGLLEFEILGLCGTNRWLETHAAPLRNEQNEITMLLGVTRDITDRKIAEDALRKSEERFRKIIELSPIPYALNDNQQNITYLNAAFIKTFGYDRNDISTLAEWWSLAYPDVEYRQWVISTWQIHLEKTKQTSIEFESIELNIRCKDGSTKTVLAQVGLFGEYNSGTHLVILYDITERKQAELALQEKEYFLRSITNHIPNMISYWTKELICKFANREYINYFDYTPEQIQDIAMKDLLGEGLFKKNKPYMQAVLQGKNQLFERKIITRQGVIKFFLLHYVANIVNDTVEGFFVLANDITEIKKAQLMTQESEESLNKAQKIAKIGSWEFDLKTFKLTWSKEHYRIFELAETPDDKLYEAYRSKIHPHDIPRLDEVVENAVKKGEGFTYEHRVMCNDGSIKYVVGIGEVTKDEHNQAIKLRGTVQDITERKQAELALQEKEYFLRSVANHIPGMLGYWTKNLICKFANKEYLDYFGYTSLQMQGISIQELFGDELFQKNEPYIQAVLNGENQQFERELINQRGETKFTLVHYIADVVDGRIEGFFVLVSDITEIKKAQLMTQESEESLNKAQKIAKIGSWEFDLKTFKQTWSKEHYRIFELAETPDDKLYEAYRSKIHPDDIPRLDEIVENAVKKGEGFTYEHRVICNDGSIKYVVGIGEVARDEHNQAIKLRGTVQDITERKQNEEKYRRNNQILEESQSIARLGGWELDLISNELYWTAETYRIYDTSPVEFTPTIDAEAGYLLPESKKQISEALELAMTEGKDYDLYLETYTTKGRKIDLRTTCEVTMTDGKPIKLTGIFQDITDRKNIERQLIVAKEKAEENEQKFRILFEQAAIGVAQIDTQTGKFVKINQKYTEIIGYTIEEILQLDFQVITYPDDLSEDLGQMELLKNGKIRQFKLEKRYFHKKGHIIWVELSVSPMWKAGEKPDFHIAVVSDISERKRLEKAVSQSFNQLQKHKQKLESITQALDNSAIVSITDLEGKIIKVNQKFCELSNYSEEELLDQSHHILNSGHHPKEFWRKMWQTIVKGKTWRGEVKNRAKDGSEYWVDTINNPILDVNGKIIQYLSIRFDITERKKMEEQLYRLSMVAQRTSNAVVITDVQRLIIWVNEGFVRMTGYTFEEVLGKNLRLFQFEDTDKHTLQMLRQKLNKTESIQCEVLNRRKSGESYCLDIEIQPLWDNQNKHIGFMAIETDITERKKNQQELNHLIEITQNQNQRLREYAHITSHNMRSSVANLLGLSELLKEEPSNEMFLEMMSTSVQQLDNTIHTMNSLLDVENESQMFAKSKVNLLQVVQNNCLLIQNLIKDKVKIILDIPTDLTVNVIPAYLDSILNNLITNAIKYRRSEIESIVEISAWTEKNGVILSVKDNGIGIDLERNGAKIFKMKSRFHLQVEGKGMGLFFTRHQIEAMGGKITVESKPTQGSNFRVWFYEN